MDRYLTLNIYEGDPYTSTNHDIEEHPSGFQAVLLERKFIADDIFKGYIDNVKMSRNPFSIHLHPNVHHEDPKMTQWVPDLIQLHAFFSGIHMDQLKLLRKYAGWWNYHYGRYDEQKDYSEHTNELLDKYAGQPYFLVEGDFSNIFAIETFKNNLKKLRIEKIHCWDNMGIMFFLSDLEVGTFQKAFDNLFKILEIETEITAEMNAAALKYCAEKKPWEFIK